MESSEGRKDTVGDLQEASAYSYSTEYLEHLIDSACELIKIMTRAGYSREEKCSILGLGNKPYREKERILLNAIITGKVSPNDNVRLIAKKLEKEKKLSPQSWNIALNRLIENGDLG